MNRIMNVYYGVDSLPYKDKERTIHFPIIGNAFAGSSNYNKIRFYVQDIGGVNTVTWIAITKLPNGRVIYEPLSTIGLEDGENYLELDISLYYTQVKGDIYISLNGCDGDVTITEDSETHIQDIEATLNQSTIVTTGPIKLPINYSVQRPYGFSFDIDQYQAILNALSSKSNVVSTIQVVNDISNIDLSGYNNDQLFYDKETSLYYKKIETTPYYEKVEDFGLLSSDYLIPRFVVDQSETCDNIYQLTQGRTCIIKIDIGGEYLAKLSTTKIVLYDIYDNRYYVREDLSDISFTISSVVSSTYRHRYLDQQYSQNNVYGIDNGGNQVTIPFGTDTGANKIAQRDSNGQINVPQTPTSDNHATSKKYVDSIVLELEKNAFIVVDTTIYPTLQDFLDDDLYGEEGYIYLYPIDTTDLTKGYYEYIWEKMGADDDWFLLGTTQIDLSDYYNKAQADNKFVAKSSDGDKVYGTNALGLQKTFDVDSDIDAGANGVVVRRNSGTGTIVVGTPTSDNHATTKAYVDANFQLKLVSGTNIKSLNGQTLLGSGNISFINYIDHSMLSQDIGDNFESVNLFDKTKIVSGGYYNSSGGVNQQADSDYSTQYIRVKYGVTYKVGSIPYAYQFCTYDKNGAFIERLNVTTLTMTFGQNVAFIRIGYYNHHFASNFMFCERDKYPSSYQDYKLETKTTAKNINGLPIAVSNVIADNGEGMTIITKSSYPTYANFFDNCYAGYTGAKSNDNNFASIEIKAITDFDIWIDETISGYLSLCLYNTSSWDANYFVARYRNDDNNLPSSSTKLSVLAGQCIVISYRKTDTTFNFSVDGLLKNLIIKSEYLLNEQQIKQIGLQKVIVTKSGDNFEITMGKYKFPFNKANDTSANLSSYDINSVYLNNNVLEAGNIIGVVKEYGESDFMGGVQHGDEQMISMNIYCDGMPITDSTQGNKVDIYLISNLQRVSTKENVIKRLVHIVFENNKMTIETTFRCLVDNFSCENAYVGMWGQYTSKITAIFNNVDEYDISNYSSKIFDHDLLKTTTYVSGEGLVTINFEEGYKQQSSNARYVYYSDSLRLKNYFSLANGLVLNTNDILYGKSVYDFS